MKIRYILKNPRLHCCLNVSKIVINMEIIIISDKNTGAPAAIKTEKQPKVVVLVGFFLVMQKIYD